MKRFLAALLVLGLAVQAAFSLTIRHTQPRLMEGTAFTRFGQLLGHSQSIDPTRLALFTNEKQHAGLFFVAELDTPLTQLPQGTVAVLQLLAEDDKAPQQFRFKLPSGIRPGVKTLYLGLTQPPFHTLSQKEMPRILAWRISLLDPQSQELAAAPSALWQK